MPNICVFEDEKFSKLLPLAYMRPVYGLRCGMTILLEKILRQYPRVALDLNCREYLVEIVKKSHLTAIINKLSSVSSCLFLNGRILANLELAKKIPLSGPDEIFVKGDTVIAARLSKDNLLSMRDKMSKPLTADVFKSLGLPEKIVDVKLINYPFDLILENPKVLIEDIKALVRLGTLKGKVQSSAVVYEKNAVFIDDRAEVMAHSVLDASDGPIYISKAVKIYPHSFIQGPVYIGEDSIILGGKIREGTSIGPKCKVHGEVAETIIHGYSNKQHEGFIGHSYICEWVNIGAGTVTSDLKNNYGHVKVWAEGDMVDSGQMFIGSFIGDHSKIGIGTKLDAGTVIGVASSVFGGGIPPKYVPSFSWGGAEGLTEHKLEKALQTAKIVMSRRDIEMGETDDMLLRKTFEMTKGRRGKTTVKEEKEDI